VSLLTKRKSPSGKREGQQQKVRSQKKNGEKEREVQLGRGEGGGGMSRKLDHARDFQGRKPN